jgi:hypothetical protein
VKERKRKEVEYGTKEGKGQENCKVKRKGDENSLIQTKF